MPEEYRKKLIEFRVNNPNRSLTLIYDNRLLATRSQSELLHFCQQHAFIPKEVSQDIIPNCTTDNEKKLIQFYEDEINHLDDFGSLNAASDLLPWLEPIYNLGIYSALDVFINLQGLSEKIQVKAPLILNLRADKISNFFLCTLKNNIIAITNKNAAYDLIQDIHQAMIHSRTTNMISQCIHFIEQETNKLEPLYRPIIQNESNLEVLHLLQKMELPPSPRLMRVKIDKVTQNATVFARFFIKDHQAKSDQEVINRCCTFLRNNIQVKLKKEALSNLKFTYQRLIQLQNTALLENVRLNYRHNMFATTVQSTTGSSLMVMALLKKILCSPEEYQQCFDFMSLYSYRLNHYIKPPEFDDSLLLDETRSESTEYSVSSPSYFKAISEDPLT